MTYLNFWFPYIFDLLIYLPKWIEQPRNLQGKERVLIKFLLQIQQFDSRISLIETLLSWIPMCTWTRKTFSILPKRQTSFPKKLNQQSKHQKTRLQSKWSPPKKLWNKTSMSLFLEHKKTLLFLPQSWWKRRRENWHETPTILFTRLVLEDLGVSGKLKTNNLKKFTQWKKFLKPSKEEINFRVIMKKSVNSVINEKILLD